MPKIQPDVKNRIIRATRALIDEKKQDFTMKEIAKKCGIGTGTIYNYYDCKTDILIDIAAMWWENCLVELRKVDSPDFFVCLHQFYGILCTFLDRFIEELMSMLLGFNEEGKQKSVQLRNKYTRMCGEIIIDCVDRHRDQLDEEALEMIGREKLPILFFNYIFGMLRNRQTDYERFEFCLKRIIEKR